MKFYPCPQGARCCTADEDCPLVFYHRLVRQAQREEREDVKDFEMAAQVAEHHAQGDPGDEQKSAKADHYSGGEGSQPYVDRTGTDEKPNPLRDVYLEFPLAMTEIARVTAYGADKHAPRGWQTFDSEYGMTYHQSKVGRHLLAEETEGPVNAADGFLLHAAQAAWNQLAYLEHLLRARGQSRRRRIDTGTGRTEPDPESRDSEPAGYAHLEGGDTLYGPPRG